MPTLRVNDSIYSWTSCIEKIDNSMVSPISGVPWKIVACSWEEKVEVKTVYRNRTDGRPAGATGGRYSVESPMIRMLRDSAMDLRYYLQLQGVSVAGPRGSITRARFSLMLQVSEPILGAVPITYNLPTCRVIGAKDAHEEGIDELVTEFALWCPFVDVNGTNLYSDNVGLAGQLL